MADARMPEEFYEAAYSMLPAEKEVGPLGGRPTIPHRNVLKVIWYVLVVGCRWKDVHRELGCCGETARRRMQQWEQQGIWSQLHQVLLRLLHANDKLELTTTIIDSTQVRAIGGGDKTGPSPVDRRKKGTKFTLLVDRNGVPLVIRAAPANASDHQELLPTVMQFPKVAGKRGRPRTNPKELYADAGYDSASARVLLRWLGITPHIRKRNQAHGSHLGRVRWVVERTISWIKGLRRMRVRYDRSQLSIDAWTSISAAAICLHIARETIQ